MSEKKEAILASAVHIVQAEGYAALTMRRLATECDIKLASLQYHFNNWDALIEAIAAHILQHYAEQWGRSNDAIDTVSLPTFIDFIWTDIEQLHSARLWPQLRAWGLVEPRMQAMLAEIYGHYMGYLEKQYRELGCAEPKVEALAMMSMLEGASIFAGRGATYFSDLKKMKKRVIANLGERFPQMPPA